MYYANDNATDNIVPLFQNVPEGILDSPSSLLAEDIHSDLYMILEDEGYDMSQMETCRDLAVIIEMVKAMLRRQDGEYHTYQEFLDQVVIAHDPTEV